MAGLVSFREQHPEYDDLSDYDLATSLYDKFYDGKIERETYFKELGINQEYEEMSTVDYALGLPSELLAAPVRGLGQGLLSSGAGLAHIADAATNRAGDFATYLGAEDVGSSLESLIDSGEENEIIRLANEGKQALDSALGVDEAYRDSYAVKVSEALGSIASFAVPGLGLAKVAGALGASAKAAGAIGSGSTFASGSGFGADDQAQRIAASRAKGIEIDQDTADSSIIFGGIVGATEALTPLGVLKKVRGIKEPRERLEALNSQRQKALEAGDEVLATNLLNQQIRLSKEVSRVMNGMERVKSSLGTGAKEGLQEVVNSLAQDAIQVGMYDDSIEVGESLWDDFTVGFGAGALVDGVSVGVANRRNRIVQSSLEEKEAVLREEEENQREIYYSKADIARHKAELREKLSKESEYQEGQDAGAVPTRGQQLEAIGSSVREGQQFNPKQQLDPNVGSYGGTSNTETYKGIGKTYASQIAKDASLSEGVFPDAGDFKVITEQVTEQVPTRQGARNEYKNEYKVVHSIDGKEYGSSAVEYEAAAHLASNLNQELINRNITNSVIDSLDLAPDAYSPQQSESLFMVGQKLVRPQGHTITAEVLNEAANTTTGFGSNFVEGLSIDALHQQQYGVPPLTDRGQKIYKPLSNMTAAQQINFERRKNGQPEKAEFTQREAKLILGDKYPRVFDVLVGAKEPDASEGITDFGSVGAEAARRRKEYQDDRSTKAEIKSVLESKNIVSDVDSPQLSYAFEQIVNESNVSKMSPSQRLFLVSELKKLPIIPGDAAASLPDFRPKSFTRRQYNEALTYVTATGDGTVANIESQLPDVSSEKRKRVVATALQKALKNSGVVQADDTVPALTMLPSPPQPPTFEIEPYKENVSEEAQKLEQKLSKTLKGFGLDDVRLRVLDALKYGPVTRDGQLILEGDQSETDVVKTAAGYYNSSPRTTFLALDRANMMARDESPEAREAALAEILDHEVVHAVRDLDLWEDAEWRLLENAVKKKIFPGTGNETFYNNAQRRYDNLPPVSQMEEAVAEFVRYARKDRSLISGKPRSLINRMFNFFEKTGNALNGTGFQSFESVLDRLESGEIGGRKRGQIRSLKALEKGLQAVPERGIGREIDETFDRVAPLPEEAQESAEVVEDPTVSSSNIMMAKSSSPIEGLVERAKTKYADYNSAVEEEFFGNFWPKVMSEVKGTVDPSKVRTASKRAIKDIQTFVSKNPKYADYYAEDMRAIKAALEGDYGTITDDDMLFYQVSNGLTSPATVLSANVGDALNLFELYKKKGNLNDIELGLSPKGNRVVASSPFQISGTTAPTKAMSLKVFDSLIQQFSNRPNPVKAAVDYLREGVTAKELQQFNRQMGYKSNVSGMSAIKSLVKQATGQDEVIPRMFIFGKKIGSYTLNLTGDSRYTTIDVWESRFIRSYFEGLFEKNTGVPVTVDEDKLFQEFSTVFKEEYDKISGKTNDPASLQAMRWFYMINSAKEAGYRGASTNETISEITKRQLERFRKRREAGRESSDATPNTEILASRIEEGQQAAEEFAQRNPEGSIIQAADQNPEIKLAVAQQEMLDGATPLSIQSGSHTLGNKFVYQIQDKLVGLKNVEKQINDWRKGLGLKPLTEEESPYRGEESVPGKIGFAGQEFEENRKKPLANKIAKNGLDLNDIDEFLTLRHAIERNKTINLRDSQRDPEVNPGSGSLKTGEPLTDSFVKDRMRNRYGMTWNDSTGTWSGGNSRAKKFLDVAQDVDQIVRETMNTTVAGGLISRENADVINSAYKYYAPLRGKEIEDDYAESVITSSGLSTKGKESLRAMGRESAAQSPLGHIMLNAERAIVRSIKNKEFGQRLVNLVKSSPDNSFWRVISPDDPRMSRGFEKKYTYVGKDPDMQGQKFTEVPEGYSRKDFLQLITVKPDFLSPTMDNDLIGVKVDGKQVYVEITDKRMRDAVISFDVGTVDGLLQKFSVVNRWLSMVNTSLNPEFVIGNFSRDVQTAIFNILGEQDMSQGKARDQELVRKVMLDVVPSMGVFYKGLRRYNPKTGSLTDFVTGMSPQDKADFLEFMQAGAKADWFHSRPPEDQIKSIQSMVDMANGTFKGNFQSRFNSVKDFIEDSNSAVENAVRLATFKASRDEMLNSGVPRAEAVKTAASLAKNLTINFNRKGMAGDVLNATFLFFNASVQGTANFARGLFGPTGNPFSKEASRVKQGAVGGLIMMGALSAMRGEEESEENPKTGRSYYSEIPDYVKERNMVIMAENGKEFYTIPLPYGYNTFHVVGQTAYEIAKGNLSVTRGSADVLSAFAGSFSPIGFGPASAFPTISQPAIEIMSNENFFGSPIYRTNVGFGTELPDSQMHMGSTRAPFISVAENLNKLFNGNEQESGAVDISPDTLEHMTEFMFGGAGTFGLRNMDAFDKWSKGEKLKTKEIPFFRRIKGEPDMRQSQSDYYERRKKIQQKSSRIDSLRGRERIDYRKENSIYLSMISTLSSTEKRLQALRKRRAAARRMADKSPETAIRAATIEQKMYEDIADQQARFNKIYDRNVGRTK